MDRHSSVGIVTRYGLGGSGIESQWGARYSASLQNETHPVPFTMRTGSFPGVKRPGRGVDYPASSSATFEEEYSYTSIPHVGLRGLFCSEPYLY